MKQSLTDIIISAIGAAKASGALKVEKAPVVLVEVPREQGRGDFATTVALSMAKPEGKSPRDVAEVIKANIKDEEGVFDRIEIAGPGFLNFFLKPSAWMGVIRDIDERGACFGASKVGGGKRMQVEFVSANPTGPLHIGHGRGAAVGDSLCRILKFTGFDIQREFYINDFGSQVENLGASVFMALQRLTGEIGPALEPVEAVVETAGESDEEAPDTANLYMGEYINDIARAFMADPAFMALDEEQKKAYCREEGIRRMLGLISDTLERFKVHFDNWYSERTLYAEGSNLVEAAINELEEKGLVFMEGDAKWLRTTQFGDDKDRVLIRSNGQNTYFASDIAYHREKFQRGFEEVIDIWGADHHGYIPRMKAAVQALGHDPEDLQVLLVQLVNLMREGQPVKMSKRAGTFVTLDEVMDEVGSDACRFTFLLRRADSHLDFDLELVKRQTSENPVYYVQYAHARLCSVFRQATEKGVVLPPISDVDLGLLTLPEELTIIKKLSAFPELVEGASLSLEPHRLTYYLQDLAGELHAYYFKHRIVGDDPALSHARLYLVKAVRQVVATALTLLGVTAPEVM
ncbi:MAG TPA: arginine--tRNA ligase [Nitrospirota bacterium]